MRCRVRGWKPTTSASSDLHSGIYGGGWPHGFQEMRGYPVRVGATEAAKSTEEAARLWQVSEEQTGAR